MKTLIVALVLVLSQTAFAEVGISNVTAASYIRMSDTIESSKARSLAAQRASVRRAYTACGGASFGCSINDAGKLEKRLPRSAEYYGQKRYKSHSRSYYKRHKHN